MSVYRDMSHKEHTMKHMRADGPSTAEVEASPQKRRILFDHPIATMVVTFLFFIALINAATIGLHMAGYAFDGELKQIVDRATTIVASLIVAIVFQLRFRKEFDGMFEWSSTGLLLVVPALLYVAANLYDFEAMTFVHLQPDATVNPFPLCLILSASPGFSEEIVFRGIPAANWMRTARDEGDVMKCALFTSLMFGGIHGLNALNGAPIGTTAFQVFYASVIGFFFVAVYLRSGSIWPTIIAHWIIDFSSFLFLDLSKGGLLTEELTIGLNLYVVIGMSAALALIALIMLRRSKRQQILQIWGAKWHKPGAVTQNPYWY